jgi:hypothetical protein
MTDASIIALTKKLKAERKIARSFMKMIEERGAEVHVNVMANMYDEHGDCWDGRKCKENEHGHCTVCCECKHCIEELEEGNWEYFPSDEEEEEEDRQTRQTN